VDFPYLCQFTPGSLISLVWWGEVCHQLQLSKVSIAARLGLWQLHTTRALVRDPVWQGWGRKPSIVSGFRITMITIGLLCMNNHSKSRKLRRSHWMFQCRRDSDDSIHPSSAFCGLICFHSTTQKESNYTWVFYMCHGQILEDANILGLSSILQ
jgi:hypothetical protein